MLELMKIEIKKNKLFKNIGYFLIADVVIAVMVAVIAGNEVVDATAPFAIDLIVKTVFIVWEAVLIAFVIVEEYRNKTILMLYTYPVKRTKILISKILVVLLFTGIGVFGSQILLNIAFFFINKIFPVITYTLEIKQVAAYMFSSVMVIFLGLIPLAVGLARYSTIATIVTSVMVITIGNTSGLGFDNLLSQIPVTSTLGALGLFVTVLTLKMYSNRELDI